MDDKELQELRLECLRLAVQANLGGGGDAALLVKEAKALCRFVRGETLRVRVSIDEVLAEEIGADDCDPKCPCTVCQLRRSKLRRGA